MEKYWDFHDKNMINLKKTYIKINQKTQRQIQDIFNRIKFSFEELYQIATIEDIKMLNEEIENWKEKDLLNGYFKYLTSVVYKNSKIKNCDLILLLIYGIYIEEQKRFDEIEQKIIREELNHYYIKAQNELNNKRVSNMSDALLLMLLTLPDSKGNIWEDYIDGVIKYNVEQIHKQTLINIQQGKEINIYNNEFQNIIKKQQNARLCINTKDDDLKISGSIDNFLLGLNNQAKIEGYKTFDENAKVRFISIEDEVTTKMCHSLNNQIFNVHDWNEFERYSDSNKKVMKYKCYGLIIGLNCPPINDNFHHCRSTIEYMNLDDFYGEDENLKDTIELFIKKEKIIDINKNKVIEEAFKNKTYSSIAKRDFTGKIYQHFDKISKHKRGNIYLGRDWNNRSLKNQYKTFRHEIGHAIDYKYDYKLSNKLTVNLNSDKKNILENQKYYNELLVTKHSEYTELSDIISAITNNKVKGFANHTTEYWNKKDKIGREIFANLFSIYGNDDEFYIHTVRKYIPNICNVFEQIIKEIKL